MDNGKSSRLLDGHGPAKESTGHLTPLQIIWHRRWFVLAVMMVCVIGAAVLAHFLPKVYTRTCQIVLEPAAARTGGDFNMESYLNTQVELITKSAAIHVDALNLLQEQGRGDLPSLQGTDPLGAVRAGLTVVPGKNTDTLAISFNSRDPADAAYIVNAVVDAYTKFTSSDEHKSNGDSIKSIQSDKDKWDAQMHEQYSQRAELKGEIGKLQADQTVGNAQMQSLSALSEAVAAARIESINAQSAYEEFARLNIGDAQKLDNLLNTGQFNNMMVVPAQDGEQIKTDMFNAKERLEDLKERYLPNHPSVQAAQEKVDDLMASYVLFLHQRWVSSTDKLKRLEQNYETLQRAANDVSAQITKTLATKTAQLDELEKRLASNENLSSVLAARVQQMSSDDRIGAVRISPLDVPDPHEAGVRPSKPNLYVMVFEGMIVGLFLGMMLALIDPRVRSVEEVVAATDLPILGVIPHMARSLSLQSRGRKVHLDPMSDVSEAYRGIRSTVFFGPKGKTILVTSPLRGEGKSTMSANLAIAMAEAGQRVLLLDGDLREPMQHRIFAMSNDVGISSVVAGRCTVDRAVISSGIRGLDLLPCGPVPFNPSETINNQTFADLLSDLARRYDHVVVDSPPVMAVTDARILAAMCDLTVLVVRAEFSSKRAAQDARDGLLGFGANIVGAVVNDGPRNRQRYGYYGGYGRQNTGAKGGNGTTAHPIDRPSPINTDLAFTPKR